MKFIELRNLPDGEQKERLLVRIANQLVHDRHRPTPAVPMRDGAVLLCGCREVAVGPSVVRGDGTCVVCSP